MKIVSMLMLLVNLGVAGDAVAAGFVPKLGCSAGNAQLVIESLAGNEAKVTLINPDGLAGEWKATVVSDESDFFAPSLTYTLPGVSDSLQVVKQENMGRAGPIGLRYSAQVGTLKFFRCNVVATSHATND